MKKILFVILFAFLLFKSYSQNLVPQFVKSVVFLYHFKDIKKDSIDIGTAFIVAYPAKKTGLFHLYLITAKHVLMKGNVPFNEVSIRFNTKESTKHESISLIWTGDNKNVFVHKDKSVDLAIIPILISTKVAEFISIPVAAIYRKTSFDSLGINVGSEVFFTGMFKEYMGNKKNSPIVRFGRISLLPQEPVPFAGFNREVFFIESSSFGGNSGSPVFFHYTTNTEKGVILGGVVLGYYSSETQLNTGITAITPAEYIIDILQYPEVARLRTE